MKNLKPFLTITAGACTLVSSAFAVVIEIDTSYVVDVGNANDSTTGGLYGAVNYGYYIGTYEVTNSQYVSFLNSTAATNAHGLYNTDMSSSTDGGIEQSGSTGTFAYSVKAGFGNKAVNYVSFWDAVRFTNYLTTGGTESGVYNLGEVTNSTNKTITRDAKQWNAGGVAIASEDEWYKAAYYMGGSTNAGYWPHAHQSDLITANDANYSLNVGTLTDVGNYDDAPSYYGTYDQGGNVWEFNDGIVGSTVGSLRGGAFGSKGTRLLSSFRSRLNLSSEHSNYGFRVSSLTPIIPEPSTYAVIFSSLALAVAIMRRKGRRSL